jgi:hypothetical protein
MLTVAGLSFSAVLLGVACWRARMLRQWACLLGGALLALILIFVVAKGKGAYVWFVGPWMVAATFVLTALLWHQAASRVLVPARASHFRLLPKVAWTLVLLAPMSLCVLAAGSSRAAQWAAVAALPPGQRPADAKVALDRSIPDGAIVLADDLWAQLAPRCEVYDASLGLLTDPQRVLDRVEYVALTANHSSTPGERRRLQRDEFEVYLAENFEVVHDQAGDKKLVILGATLESSAQGFGPVVLKRRQPVLVQSYDSAPNW